MRDRLQKLYSEAVVLLRNLSTDNGLLASSIASDNYNRIWARDSMICGIAGILAEDPVIIEGLKNSLLTLAKFQNKDGIIPSNVHSSDAGNDISYGSLVGRVDTNTWFIVGACLYYLNTNDTTVWERLKPAIHTSRSYLKSIEFNGKGWVYTPLSGNWADEYPIHGYTLYDNALRIWGESLWLKINAQDDTELQALKIKTGLNFWPTKDVDPNLVYQQLPFENTLDHQQDHYGAFILPGSYDTRFDAAGNAVAMLVLGMSKDQKLKMSNFIKHLKNEIGRNLIPAFWPPIQPGDSEWPHIEGNFAFDFKNYPHHFHNGGIWPVWMGMLCLGLSTSGLTQEAEKILADCIDTIYRDDWNFQEYITSDKFEWKGKEKMGFSASGIVFMDHALNNKKLKSKLGL